MTQMVQLTRPDPLFGEVNVGVENDGRLRVVATLQWTPDMEDGRIGLALDGSASMQPSFGGNVPLSEHLGATNIAETATRALVQYLSAFDAQGRVRLVYWSCAPDGSQVEEIGCLTPDELQAKPLNGPKQWGRQTQLLPVVDYFLNHPECSDYVNTEWGMVVIITDGRFKDLGSVIDRSWEFARQVAAGQRRFIKFVIIGVGRDIDETQMEKLDDMFDGSGLCDPFGNEIDIWDHKLASDMSLPQVFAEPFHSKMNLASVPYAPRGRVLEPSGRPIEEYSDGLPYRFEFFLPSSSRAFILEFWRKDGSVNRVNQSLEEGLARL